MPARRGTLTLLSVISRKVALVLLLGLGFVLTACSNGPRISCTKQIEADRDLHIEVLMDMQTRHGGQLKAIPGLRGVGVGFIEENGELTDVLGIQVWVDPTQLPEGVGLEDLFPRRLEGCVVGISGKAI